MFAKLLTQTRVVGGAVRGARFPAAMAFKALASAAPMPRTSMAGQSRAFGSDKGVTDMRFATQAGDDEDEEEEFIDLGDAVAREIEDEVLNAEEIDSELDAIRAQIMERFELRAGEAGNALVTLSREYEGESVTVVFHTQDENREESMDDFLAGFNDANTTDVASYEEEPDVDEEEEDDSYGIDFKVSIVKGDQEMVFDCCAAMHVIVKRVAVHNVNTLLESSTDVSALYRGPDFDRLDDSFQLAFSHFLEARGIDEDMSFFILSYSQQKEQQDYVDWLQKISGFVNKG